MAVSGRRGRDLSRGCAGGGDTPDPSHRRAGIRRGRLRRGRSCRFDGSFRDDASDGDARKDGADCSLRARAAEQRTELGAHEVEESAEVERGARPHCRREPAREGTACAGQERARRGRRQLETLCDLPRRGQPLAHHEGVPLVLRKGGQRIGQRGEEFRLLRARLRQRDPVELDAVRHGAATPSVRSCVKHVLGDRREPRGLALGLDAAAQRAERVEEGRLQRVLSVGSGRKVTTAIAE
jgi:hypothetical protein